MLMIAADIAPLWAQADVVFDPVRVLEIDVPTDVLAQIAISRDRCILRRGRPNLRYP